MSGPEERRKFLGDLFREWEGAIRFDRWMKEALYHPVFGYYTAEIRDIGTRGDFTTWPVFEESLATGISRWLKDRRPSGRPWHVIEIGAGTGALAKSVLGRLGRWKAPHFHIVEISPVLREKQKARLRWRHVTWHTELQSALEAVGGDAFLFSNELVDAFPCRVFRQTQGSWEELFVGLHGGHVCEIWKSATTLPDSSAFEHAWKPGQRIEVQEAFGEWLQQWSSSWKRGEMLIIDYGAKAPEIFQRRPQGTLRAYAHHQRLEGADILEGFGRRDITCDVNFSDVGRFASQAGLAARPAKELGSFLDKTHSLHARLFAEGGAASQFQVMELQPVLSAGD